MSQRKTLTENEYKLKLKKAGTHLHTKDFILLTLRLLETEIAAENKRTIKELNECKNAERSIALQEQLAETDESLLNLEKAIADFQEDKASQNAVIANHVTLIKSLCSHYQHFPTHFPDYLFPVLSPDIADLILSNIELHALRATTDKHVKKPFFQKESTSADTPPILIIHPHDVDSKNLLEENQWLVRQSKAKDVISIDCKINGKIKSTRCILNKGNKWQFVSVPDSEKIAKKPLNLDELTNSKSLLNAITHQIFVGDHSLNPNDQLKQPSLRKSLK